MAPVSAAWAQAAATVAEQPCDPVYWDSLTSRAWLEAEREIIQNQNLIFKPDSVMEYVCFDKFVDHNANHAGEIFVHTKYFGKEIIKRGSNESMEKGLTNVVSTALNAYDTGSFEDGKFLADRSKFIKNKGNRFEYPQSATATPGNYTCKTMQEIWKTSKCINFIDNEKFKMTDGFYPFKTIKALAGSGGKDVAGYQDDFSGEKDPRQWPAALKCAGPQQTEWKDRNDVSENVADLYKFHDPLNKDFTDVRKKIEPGKCSENSTAIKTGIKVIVNGKPEGEDGVCTNPGCTYTGGKCS